MRSEPPRVVATALLKRKKSRDSLPDVAGAVKDVFPKSYPDATTADAFRRVGALVDEYQHGAVACASSPGFSSILRVDGDEIHIISCATLPAVSLKSLMQHCARRAMEVQGALDKSWGWEKVTSTDTRGSLLPVTVIPARSWWFAGGFLRCPATELGVAVVTVLLAAGIRWQWGIPAQNVFLGALLAFGVVFLRNVIAAIVRAASKGGDANSYRFRGDDDD